MRHDEQFEALGDATRRAIFELLQMGPRSVGELADEFPVSRPAVSQHLKVLKNAGLVSDEAVGTRRIYSIDPAGLEPLRGWVEKIWNQALSNFAAAVDELKGTSS
ncbi:MAG: metalloregulator ArsR/SmtB family transcription factor [Actinomycetota bacterium]|nr:metalloregulator ArsR/SmtB family transcription factor [Actinomycetota bacterium]